ncbi:hypothetical protein PINS_up015132 [Pythium insidiosum]|nr:hypothetical protein PINS_up015132 [Pythium insidiosum]
MMTHHERVPIVLLDHWLLGALSKAAKLGHDAIVRCIIDFMDDRLPISVAMTAAATLGDVALLQRLTWRCTGAEDMADAASAAAREGHLAALQCVVRAMGDAPQEQCPWLLTSAIEGGHRACIEWLVSLDALPEPDFVAETKAIKRGDLETVRWLMTRFPSSVLSNGSEPLLLALATQPQILQVLMDEFQFTIPQFSRGAVVARACSAGCLDAVKLLCRDESSFPARVDFLSSAAEARQLQVLEYLWQAAPRALWQHSEVLAGAVKSGRRDVVDWALAHETRPLTPSASLSVARHGHLEILQWLYDCNTVADAEQVMHEAAVHGHIAICEWLHEHHHFRGSWMDILRRLLDTQPVSSGEEVDDERDEREMHRRANPMRATVQWLWPRVVAQAQTMTDLSAIAALAESAARHGMLEIVRHCASQQPELDMTKALEEAATYGHVDVVRYLTQCGVRLTPLGPAAPRWLSNAVAQGYLETLMVLYESDGAQWDQQMIERMASAGAWTPASSRAFMVFKWLNSLRGQRM